MKKFILLLCVSMISIVSFSQQVPKGMKYQGVARDLKGIVLSEQKIVLRISLAGNNGQVWTPYYVETHNVETSQLGLFTLVVGEGTGTTGKFGDIPWSTNEIWMEVSIRDNSGFATISNSKLLAVPYAFHALTANELVGDTKIGELRSGIPSNTWSTFGNSNTNTTDDALGTTDNADLVIITTDVERIRVLANGNVLVKRSMDIGANLKVDSNVVLNHKLGSTINNGPFTVARNSPSLLSGTLTVDLATDLNATLNVDGKSDLNSNLNVNNQAPTKLTGTLQVDGVTNLRDSFFVAQAAPSRLTGFLRVDSNVTFKQKLILDNASYNQDTASLIPSGALQVAGGGGFGGNLTVAGSAKIGGGLGLGSLKVTDPIQSTDVNTGALVVVGGAGIGMQLNVGGKTTINNSLDINSGSGQVRINGGTAGGQNDASAYPLVVNGKTQGIEVKLSVPTTADRANNFMTFKDNSGAVRGRIEGQTASELSSDPEYAWQITKLSADVAASAVQLIMAGLDLSAALSDVRGCAGFGVVVCPPAPYIIVVKAIMFVARAAQLVINTKNLADFITMKNAAIGVVYSSGAGDYAEWLMKENTAYDFKPGQVVGINKGKVSLNTEGAEKVLVISTNPIVLGNAPQEGKEMFFEKVAFLGQVPVRVLGSVSAGDYIIASGKGDGLAISKDPKNITMDDLVNIVGVAWTGSDNVMEKSINVAVGLSTKDMRVMVQTLDKKVTQQTDELNALRAQINASNELLAKLVPGFKASPLKIDAKPVTISNNPVSIKLQETVSVNQTLKVDKQLEQAVPQFKYDRVVSKKIVDELLPIFTAKLHEAEGNRMPAMTDEMINKILKMGIEYTAATSVTADGKTTSNNLLAEINADPSLKKIIYSNIRAGYTKAVEEDKMVNKK